MTSKRLIHVTIADVVAVRGGRAGLAALGLAVGMGCGGAKADDVPAPGRGPTACEYDFIANITAGPSKGTSLVGPMHLQTDAQGVLTGNLKSSGGNVAVSGSVDDKSIHLQLEVAAGKRIKGDGPLPTGFSACPGPLSGSALGPEPNDAGDWTIKFKPET